jgi:CheY-like chemotaxis protein
VKVSLLLASADAAQGHALEKLLRDQRYGVEFVHDTQAALKAIDGSQPDALVADLKSPRVDGLALLKRARALRPDLCGCCSATTPGPPTRRGRRAPVTSSRRPRTRPGS